MSKSFVSPRSKGTRFGCAFFIPRVSRNRYHSIMVLAYHVVFSAYGFWLPNDPRGSNSEFVGAKHLIPFGYATKVTDRHSHARDPHNAALRAAAKQTMVYPAVRFTGIQARAIARGFGCCISRTHARIHACAILPNHVHMVIARHNYAIEKLVGFLKADATRSLLDEGIHPFSKFKNTDGSVPTCWGRGSRKIFLNSIEEIRNRIQYVAKNPLKEGKRKQNWSFLTAYEE
jgi:REP element-mobilizing transposase RayT